MKRFCLQVLLAVVAACLVGCGGVGAPYRGETPFVGSYTGFWNLASEDEFGTLTLTVAGDAIMNGTFRNLATGENGALDGDVERDGTFEGNVHYSDGTVVAVSGKLSKGETDGGGLSGDGFYTRPGQPRQALTFDVASSATSPFQGSYRGNWDLVSGLGNGALSVTVGQDGRVAGSFTDLVNGTNGTVEGAVQPNGKFRFVFDGLLGGRSPIVGVASGNDSLFSGDGTLVQDGGASLAFSFTTPKVD